MRRIITGFLAFALGCALLLLPPLLAQADDETPYPDAPGNSATDKQMQDQIETQATAIGLTHHYPTIPSPEQLASDPLIVRANEMPPPLTLSTSDFGLEGIILPDQVYGGDGCKGHNHSPELKFSNIPDGTQSLAVTVSDPNASQGIFYHWLVFNIPPTASGLPRNAGAIQGAGLPAGAVMGTNNFGDQAYDGPCPPANSSQNPHQYAFILWALNVDKLPYDGSVDGATLMAFLEAHVVRMAFLTGFYGR